MGPLAADETYWPGSHATDEFGRLVIVGPEGVAVGGVTTGEGAPAKFAKGALYIQIEGSKSVAIWEGRGASEEPIIRVDLSGTPADGSVTQAKFVNSLIDGAAGVAGLRSLTTIGLQIGIKPLKPASGSFLTCIHATRAETQENTGNKNIMFLTPADLVEEKEFDRISSYVGTKGEGAGLVLRLGVYAADGTYAKPTGSPLFESGEIAATEVGERFAAITQKLVPTRYWLAWVMQGTVTVGPKITTCSPVGAVPAATLEPSNFGAWKQTGVTGALPAIGTLEAAATCPLVGLRVK